MRNLQLLLVLVLLSALLPGALFSAQEKVSAIESFSGLIRANNAGVKRFESELKSAERELKAASKPSAVMLEIEGERTFESGEEKKYETKNIEFSKTFGPNDPGSALKRKNSIELKIKREQALKAIDDIVYGSYAGLLNALKLAYQKKLAAENLKIAENIIEAVTKKYEVALGSKMEIEQAVLDYEVQFLKALEIKGAFENQKAALEIENGIVEPGVLTSFLELRRTVSLTGEIEMLLSSASIAVEDVKKLYSDARAKRRDLKSALYEVELVDAMAEMERRSGSVEYKLGFFRSVNDLKEAERGVKLGVSIPVYDFGRRRETIDALKLKMSGYRTELGVKSFFAEHIERSILLDITEKYNLCMLNREKLERLGGVGLKKASGLLGMATIGYTEGATTLFEYQNAKKSYFEFFEQLIAAAFDFNISLLELRKACGVPPDENADIMGRFIKLN